MAEFLQLNAFEFCYNWCLRLWCCEFDDNTTQFYADFRHHYSLNI